MFSSDFGRKRSTAEPPEIEMIEKGIVFWIFGIEMIEKGVLLWMLGSLCKYASLNKALQAILALARQYLNRMSNSLVFYTTLL